MIELIVVMCGLFGVGATFAAWDISKRKLAAHVTLNGEAAVALKALVERAESVSERNDKALTNFLTEIRELAKYQERMKQEAAAAKFQGRPR